MSNSLEPLLTKWNVTVSVYMYAILTGYNSFIKYIILT